MSGLIDCLKIARLFFISWLIDCLFGHFVDWLIDLFISPVHDIYFLRNGISVTFMPFYIRRSGLKGEDGDSVLPKLDENYARETKKNHDAKLDKLEHDLKNYKSNSIKKAFGEHCIFSVWFFFYYFNNFSSLLCVDMVDLINWFCRRGYDEIGNHYLLSGDVANALKAFNNSRDYAEGLKEQAHMLANRLKVAGCILIKIVSGGNFHGYDFAFLFLLQTSVYLKFFSHPSQLLEQMRDVEAGLERMVGNLCSLRLHF